MREPHSDDHVRKTLTPVCNIITPVGMLGYGFNEDETIEQLEQFVPTGLPTAIILDAGSTDSGPSKLALGAMTAPRHSYVRDLTKLLNLVSRFNVPLIFSSAGGDGSDDHVKEMVGVIEEICALSGNEHYQFKTIAIFSEIQKSLVLDRLSSGDIAGCGTVVPPLTEEDVYSTPRIVSQMGPEPFIDAMKENPDFNIIVGGRAYDPSPYVAFAAYAAKADFKDTISPKAQQLWGGFTHMGKIMECGGQCASPKSHGASAVVYSDGTFEISPHDEHAKCTPASVSAHTLYEKTRPDILYGPGGYLDLNASMYEQLPDGRTCRVRGGTFTFSRDVGDPYRLKLEAATTIGYRTMFMGNIKDPILVKQIDWFVNNIVKGYVAKQHQHAEGEWDIEFHIYGQNQVSLLPDQNEQPAEIFIVCEALGPTQELANSVAAAARIATAHGKYPDQKATSGNLAWGIGGKMEVELGPCAQFSIYHLMNLKVGEERLSTVANTSALFNETVKIIGKGQPKTSAKRDSATAQIETSTAPATKKAKMSNGSDPKQNGMKLAMPKTLGDIALILRSKNAGPYEITFDVIFETEETYRSVKDTNMLDRSVVAKLLRVQDDEIIWIGYFDQAKAFKVTIPRLRHGKVVPNGSFGESDIWAAQQYLPLMNMKLPQGFVLQGKKDLLPSPAVDLSNSRRDSAQ